MFTNVAQHQQTHQFPHPQQYADKTHYKFFHRTPFSAHAVQDESPSFMRGGVYGRRLQKPQQYACPLQTPPYFPGQEPSADAYTAKPDVSEHMLRRKTPNGTLAAGYDGRPLGWTARPHATKHLLMPGSSTTGDAIHQSLVADTMTDDLGVFQARSFAVRDKEKRQILHGNFTEKSCDKSITPIPEPRPNMHPSAGLDSVLNQGSSSYQYGSLADGQRVPTVLQPMWPPTLGLTSLNDPGSYGPYWPDGAFAPYRPAPLQDLRYPYQIRNVNSIETNPLQLPYQNREEWNSSYDGASYKRDPIHPAPILPSDNEFNNHYLEPDQSRIKTTPRNREPFPPQHYQIPLVHRGKQSPPRNLSEQQKFSWDLFREPSFAGLSKASHNASQISVLQVNHVQFKEKVLIWAHKVYVNLLASVQQFRRNVPDIDHGGDRRFQSSVYPKPPRHFFLNSSRDHSFTFQEQKDVGALEEIEDNVYHQTQQLKPQDTSQSRPLAEQDTSTQCLPNESPCYNHYSQQIWQSNGPQQSFLHSAVSSINQSRSTVPLSNHNQHEMSPSSAAVTALEMLNRLCQESGWEWIDGMLLGGCLAYGLGDHTKAMKWYTRVLSCDPK